ncbi:N-lysine methyltransferase KMT5A-like isoform X1 [Saccostrea cucullata]|uniref:N-lysine methyltransferase KMT5A-like isoform X1 n=1 Tax=Saccostrea cuccullata TaxID=36930 RepID=UPI002ED627B0
MRKKWVNPLEESQLWVKKDPPGFEIDVFENKGRGIRTTVSRQRGDFLLVYAGQLLSKKEGERREKKKSSGYRYFYRDLCIDATKEDGRLCRLVNHGTKTEINCKMKLYRDCLCLFATRDMKQGEELLYDYGLNSYPWKSNLNSIKRMIQRKNVVLQW